MRFYILVKVRIGRARSKLFHIIVSKKIKKLHLIRVIHKVTAQTPVCIFKEESEHQTHLCTKTRQKKIWIVV